MNARIRAKVALKRACLEIADAKWPASKEQADWLCRSDEAVGYADALFDVAVGKVLVPAFSVSDRKGGDEGAGPSSDGTREERGPKGDAQKQTQNKVG